MKATELAVGVREIAELLHVSEETVYRQARAGDIPAFKMGRLWRFFPSDVTAHLSKPADPWAYSSQSRAARRRSA